VIHILEWCQNINVERLKGPVRISSNRRSNEFDLVAAEYSEVSDVLIHHRYSPSIEAIGDLVVTNIMPFLVEGGGGGIE